MVVVNLFVRRWLNEFVTAYLCVLHLLYFKVLLLFSTVFQLVKLSQLENQIIKTKSDKIKL